MKAFLTILIMLFVSPFLAEVGLLCLEPGDGGGGGFSLAALPGFFLFSLPFIFLTVPLWPTYFPALILTPFILGRIARQPGFRTMKLRALLGLSLAVGAVLGTVVMSWLIVIAARESAAAAWGWAGAGAFSGSLTLALVTLVYRHEPRTD